MEGTHYRLPAIRQHRGMLHHGGRNLIIGIGMLFCIDQDVPKLFFSRYDFVSFVKK